MKDKLIKPKDAAEYLGITMGTFYNWVSQKRLDVVKLSKGAVRVKQSVLERMVEKHTQIAVKAES